MRIALLHLLPRPGDLAYNRQLVETAVETAADSGADWILTPELVISGYTFADQIGTDWIMEQPDPWMAGFCKLVARLQVTVFLSHPERDSLTGKLYNSVFVITPEGAIAGKHQKVNTLRVGSEAWSSPGDRISTVPAPPFDSVGILICADAYPAEIAGKLKEQGAQVLVSVAAWAPGFHGPNGEWEQRSLETGLPLFVCNRTGSDRTLDFSGAESVVIKDGRRLLSFSPQSSSILLFDWDPVIQDITSQEPQKIFL
jgi:predicted amidohydrolase